MLIKFYGEFACLTKENQINITLKNQTTIRDLLYLLVSRYPQLKEVLPPSSPESWCDYILIIDNGIVYKNSDCVSDDNSLIIAPPLSGG